VTNSENYLEVNRKLWDERTKVHVQSDFYDLPGFRNGITSLQNIELDILPKDLSGKDLLHLQCHFGLDTMSLSRMGASSTGVDFSPAAVKQATELAEELDLDATFICEDILSFEPKKQYDIVFSSYGTVGWLPDIKGWAKTVNAALKPGGKFYFIEFHPIMWMLDDDFEKFHYPYSSREVIAGSSESTYTGSELASEQSWITWNYGFGAVIGSLLETGLKLEYFKEYDHSPYNIHDRMVETDNGEYQIKGFEGMFPLTYSLIATK